jgi:L-2-hydroxyglutarate oxidase
MRQNVIYDYLVIGGGIVGVSTAWQLKDRNPGASIALLEKEPALARHQTGRNSGVIHAGVYYAPGSLKANFCKLGARATRDFCDTKGIPYEQCGKLLVATNVLEAKRMSALYDRCVQNEIDTCLIGQDELCRREPRIAGLGAIFVPETGIVDFSRVCMAMADNFVAAGGAIYLTAQVIGLEETREEIVATTTIGKFRSKFLVACAGLAADRVARMIGSAIDFQIVPFRGEYYVLPDDKRSIVKHLIYPIPDPDLPFLGVHLTRMIDGSVTVGPNAVQGWKREGYGRLNFSPRDVWEMLRFPGYWRFVRRNFRTGLAETADSVWKRGYLARVRKYCSEVDLSDLKPHPVGIRAQAVLRDGSLVHDFLFTDTPRSLHVCNAPSPAATSAIPIGGYICDRVFDRSKRS